MPATAPRVLAQLGYAYPYGADGNGGPPILERARLGRACRRAGAWRTPEPLFPRLDVESAGAASPSQG